MTVAELVALLLTKDQNLLVMARVGYYWAPLEMEDVQQCIFRDHWLGSEAVGRHGGTKEGDFEGLTVG